MTRPTHDSRLLDALNDAERRLVRRSLFEHPLTPEERQWIWTRSDVPLPLVEQERKERRHDEALLP